MNKKLKLSFIFLCLFLLNNVTISARAEEDEKKTDEKEYKSETKKNSCHFRAQNKMTPEQHKKMKDAYFKFQEDKIRLEEALKLARLNWKKIITDPSVNYIAAKSAGEKVAEAVNKLVAAKLDFKAIVDFQILTAEQRKHKNARLFWHHQHEHGCDHGFSQGQDRSDHGRPMWSENEDEAASLGLAMDESNSEIAEQDEDMNSTDELVD